MGFMRSVALVLSIFVFMYVFYMGFICCVYLFVIFIIVFAFMGWCNCVFFLAEAGRPRLFRLNFGGSYLVLVMIVVSFGVAFGVKFVYVLLGPVWCVVIGFTGVFRESSVIVCWSRVCLLIVFMGWSD